ncbi:hypothetical protein [Salinibacter ruber]|uniref:hypothetical protein n=1 Tax=Salinibacter ruber TaxID=146919 RepID=UPI0021680948|nr:hypothetical protein [Salinibacter ruber]MCS3758264.1 hypothetical protein [Salinibacter ruber]
MNLTSIFTGIGAALAVGLVQSVVGPLVEWYVEQKRNERERRRRLIQDWREMIRDVWRNGRIMSRIDDEGHPQAEHAKIDSRYEELYLPNLTWMLRADERYYSLRSRMRPSAREEIEEDRAIRDTGLPQGLQILSEEIDRIESEWELVGEESPKSDESSGWYLGWLPFGR